MRILHLICCAVFFLISSKTFSQAKNTVYSGDYKNKPLREVISEIEANGNVKFYFILEIVDTVNITASFQNEPLKNAVDIILDNTSLYFYIVDNKVTLYIDLGREPIERFTISGVVKDNYGKFVRNAVVVLMPLYEKQVTTDGESKYRFLYKKQVATNGNGEYSLDNLKPGRYQLRFNSDDHYRHSEQLNILAHTTLNVKLQRKEGVSSSTPTPGSADENIQILKRVVSIKGTENTTKEILDQASSLGKFSFEYDPTIISSEQKVILKTNSLTVKEILDATFAGSSIVYTEFENKIILRKKNPNPLKYTISGNVKDEGTGENLIGVSVGVKGTTYGNISNQYGYYSLTIPEGDYVFVYSYVGYQTTMKEVSLFKNLKLDISLSDNMLELQEVVISSEETLRDVSEINMGTTKLGIKTIKSMPAFLGEVDVIKSITLLPGVATVGEGTTGFNVRGGAVDQNLVILDEAPVYNTSHLFGFFSVFNPDIVKDVKLYKSGIPARYGGRLSSVLDVTQKDGNNQKLSGSGGLGILGGRLALEGPLIKDRSSFILAGRKSYIGELLKGADDFKNTTVGFYDLNAKVNFKINEKNRIYWSGYAGKDNFALVDDDIKIFYSNLTTTLRWNHLFSDKLFSNFSAVYSNYKYGQGSTEKNYEFEGTNGIVTYNLKSDFTYYLNAKHTIDYGLNFLFYQFKGLKVGPASETSPYATINIQDDYAVEPAVYVQDEYSLNSKLKFSIGLRYSTYYNIGPGSVYVYQDNLPRDISNITDTIQYSTGKIIKQYGGLEPRLGVKLNISKNSVLQLSYDRSRQYIHLISNTTSATPLDVWKGSGSYVKPEIGDQFSIGYFRNFNENAIEASVEVYYKSMNNIVDYKDGANLIINKAIDADLLLGKGRAYGIEFTFNKTMGRLTGWVSYTRSQTERQVNGKFMSEKINNGKYYPSNYNFPNRVTLFAAYKISPRFSLSFNFTYNTGRPTTFPEGRYYYAGFVVPQYSSRNQDKLSDYHRLDLSATLEGKQHKNWQGQWVFSIFNVYGRKNAYSIYLKRIRFSNDTESIRLSILGSVLPSLTYNFKF